MERYPGAENLLEQHPEGLGKHIEVYQLNPPGYKIDGYFFKENISNDRLPFMFSYNNKDVYLVILGSDLVHHLPYQFDIEFVQQKINVELNSYIKQIWEYLKLDPAALYVQLIGWQQ